MAMECQPRNPFLSQAQPFTAHWTSLPSFVDKSWSDRVEPLSPVRGLRPGIRPTWNLKTTGYTGWQRKLVFLAGPMSMSILICSFVARSSAGHPSTLRSALPSRLHLVSTSRGPHDPHQPKEPEDVGVALQVLGPTGRGWVGGRWVR